MTSLGISPEKASLGMSTLGICEGTSRVIFSFFGDRLKGHLVFSYAIASLCLSVVNFLGMYTFDYPTVLIFILGKPVKKKINYLFFFYETNELLIQ